MRRKAALPLLLIVAVLVLAAGCAGLQVNPAKASLYTMKEEVLAVREYVITEHLAGRLDDATFAKYKALDDKFYLLYNATLDLVTAGNNPGGVETNKQQLQELLLEIRRNYYPKKGG